MITPDGMITANFSLREMIHSDTAVTLKIRNVPNAAHLDNLIALCENVLQPLRDKLGVSVRISSGFRCRALNKVVGGAANSQHLRGEAADINAEGLTPNELFHLIILSEIEYDQIIEEFGEWVHVSFSRTGKNRKQALLATKKGKKTIFTKLYNTKL